MTSCQVCYSETAEYERFCLTCGTKHYVCESCKEEFDATKSFPGDPRVLHEITEKNLFKWR